MIETTLLATSEKLWPLACRIFGAPCSSSAKEVAKKFSIPARPLSVRRSPRAASLSPSWMRNTWLAWSNAVRSAASRSFFSSIKKCCFDK
jgi:hypothetical protein